MMTWRKKMKSFSANTTKSIKNRDSSKTSFLPTSLIKRKLQINDYSAWSRGTNKDLTTIKNIVIGLLCELNRALDTMSIDIISEQLFNIDIRGNLNELNVSFMSNRYVMACNLLSDEYSVTTGPPQGSILCTPSSLHKPL